jgi:menaquinol-cytochrome c reductase iron-sulfur subunit
VAAALPPRAADAARRRFLVWGTVALSGLIGVALGVPLVASLVGPALRRARSRLSPVGPVSAIPAGAPVLIHFVDTVQDAFLQESALRTAWAVRSASGRLQVFSPVCTHLGCHYDWVAAQGRFHCPCHGSFFALDGTVLAGPAPRPLDTLPAEVRGGELYVAWEEFEPGIPEKKAI